jgi:hypothetical protein
VASMRKNQMKAVMDHVMCSSFGVVALATEEVAGCRRCQWSCHINNVCGDHCKSIGRVCNKSLGGSRLSISTSHGCGMTCKVRLHSRVS